MESSGNKSKFNTDQNLVDSNCANEEQFKESHTFGTKISDNVRFLNQIQDWDLWNLTRKELFKNIENSKLIEICDYQTYMELMVARVMDLFQARKKIRTINLQIFNLELELRKLKNEISEIQAFKIIP